MKLPGRRAIVWLVALFGAVAIAVAATTSRPPPPSTNPPGTWAFAVLGDAPYNPGEDRQYPHLLAQNGTCTYTPKPPVAGPAVPAATGPSAGTASPSGTTPGMGPSVR